MKILFVITKSNWGGAQRYVYDLSTSIAQRGHAVSIALGGTGEIGAGTGALARRLETANITYDVVPSFTRSVSLLRDVQLLGELISLMRRIRPDVVHLNSSKAAGVGALAARWCGIRRIVFTVHGFPFTEMRPWYERTLITFATWVTFLLVTDIITICTKDRVRAQRYWGVRHKVRFIPNGIAKHSLPTSPQARECLKKKYPPLAILPPETAWLATGTELTARKRIDVVISACARLTTNTPWHLAVVGVGEEETSLKALAEKLGVSQRVTFLGFVAEFENLLPAFDCFILASYKEGLPYSVLEVAYAGVPLIACAIDGIPDIVRDGHSGWLVPSKETQKIKDALTEILNSPEEAKRRARLLQQHAHETFSLQRMSDDTLAVYEGMTSTATSEP